MPSSPKTSTGFVSLADYLGANQPAVQRTVGGITDAVSDEATRGKADADKAAGAAFKQAKADGVSDFTTAPGYSDAQRALSGTSQAIQGLGGFGGLAQRLQSQFGGQSPYSAGDRALDANLTGAAGHGAFEALRSKYSGLDSYLGDTAKASAAKGMAMHGAADNTPLPGHVPAPSIPDPVLDNDPGQRETAGSAKNWKDGPPDPFWSGRRTSRGV